MADDAPMNSAVPVEAEVSTSIDDVSISNIVSLVDSISAKLELALIAQDWEAVKLLDDQLRGYFQRLERMNALSTEKADDGINMVAVMQKLATTYQKVLQACEQHRTQIQQEMSGLRQGRKGIQAYQGI